MVILATFFYGVYKYYNKIKESALNDQEYRSQEQLCSTEDVNKLNSEFPKAMFTLYKAYSSKNIRIKAALAAIDLSNNAFRTCSRLSRFWENRKINFAHFIFKIFNPISGDLNATELVEDDFPQQEKTTEGAAAIPLPMVFEQ